MSQAPLYILGSSGHAQEIAAYARVIDPERRIYFVDDGARDGRCLTLRDYLSRVQQDRGESILGAGRCEIRRRMLQQIIPPFATIIHPSAVVMGTIGPGCVIAPGAIVAPNTHLDPHVLVNYNATIGHDAIIRRLSVIGPGANVSGWCVLDEAVYVGAGAQIREHIEVSHDVIVAMGAVVTANIPSELIAIGVPARHRTKEDSGGGWLK